MDVYIWTGKYNKGMILWPQVQTLMGQRMYDICRLLMTLCDDLAWPGFLPHRNVNLKTWRKLEDNIL